MFFSRKASNSKENTTASGAPNLGASGSFSLKPEEETFPRAPSGGSGLLGLFSSGSASDTSSLTFQRPVQPSAKPKEAPPPEAAKPPPPGTSLYAACVPVFRNVSGAWNPVGNAGVALVTGK